MISCRKCEQKLELEYQFCPRCGMAIGNELLAPAVDACVHVRHGALPICVVCGNAVFDDETDLRKSDNVKWGIAAGGCSILTALMFFLANPSRVPKDTNDTAQYAAMARVELTIAILGIGGIVFCLYRMKLFGERDN